jgi:quercetin dioxygenase-like cupin family protein
VQARRLRAGAEIEEDPGPAVATFVAFFETESLPHFREEEDLLFPLVADLEEARPLLTAALLEHQRLRALVGRLETATDPRPLMREIGGALEAHVRLEERELFPLIERTVADELERGALGAVSGGQVWGLASDDLNATLLAWPAGAGPAEHVNDERDVLVFVLDGSAALTVDGEERELRPGEGLIVEKGRRRLVRAGPRGVRYLSAHLRRPPLQIRAAGSGKPG